MGQPPGKRPAGAPSPPSGGREPGAGNAPPLPSGDAEPLAGGPGPGDGAAGAAWETAWIDLGGEG